MKNTDKEKRNNLKIYIDESGNTPYYNDPTQPVLTLTGVVSNKDETHLNNEIKSIFQKFKIPVDTEIHTCDIFSKEPPFNRLNPQKKQEFVFDLINIGLSYIECIHYISSLKPFIKPGMRNQLKKRNLDLYLDILFRFLIEVDFYFNKKINSSYSLHFDKISGKEFNKRTKKMVEELNKKTNDYYYLNKFNGKVDQIDSKYNRFIQLSDLFGFIFTRYRQFEIGTFNRTSNLAQYEHFYKNCYSLLNLKLMNPLSLVMEIISTEDTEIWNKLGYEKRNFSHIKGWLTKKRKIDKFDYKVSSYWIKQNKTQKESNANLFKILASHNMPKRFKKSWVSLFKYDLKKMINSKDNVFSELPEVKRSLDLINQFEKNDFTTSGLYLNSNENMLINLDIKPYMRVYFMLVNSSAKKLSGILTEILKKSNEHAKKILNDQKKFFKNRENNRYLWSNIKQLSSMYSDFYKRVNNEMIDLYVIKDILIDSLKEIDSVDNILGHIFSNEIDNQIKEIKNLKAITSFFNQKISELIKSIIHFRNIGVDVTELMEMLDGLISNIQEVEIYCDHFLKRFDHKTQ